MGKSREQKQLEQKMLVNKTLNNMRGFVKDLEPKVTYFIEKAKEAKAKGLTQQYKTAARAVITTMTQKKRIEGMLLWFEIANQSKEVTEMMSNYFKGMEIVSNEMSRLTTKDRNFAKTLKSMEKGMMAYNVQSNRADTFMERIGDIFDGFVEVSGEGNVSESELDKLIDGMLISEESDKSRVGASAATEEEKFEAILSKLGV